MSIEQTRDQVDRLRARLVTPDSGTPTVTLALALADQLNSLSAEFAMRGDYETSAAHTMEALRVIAAHVDPLTLPPAEAFKYAGLIAGLAQGLLMDERADDAAGLLDHAITVHWRLSHLAGESIAQPTFEPPPPPATPAAIAASDQLERQIDDAPAPASPYADDQPPVPFAAPPGALCRLHRGWGQPADWTFIAWQLLCARARAHAALGDKDKALADAVEALSLNLLGTELDYARMVASASTALKTAWLLIEGIEPEEGPLGW